MEILNKKISLEGLNNRFRFTQERSSDVEDRLIEIIQFKKQKENEQKLREIWYTIKHNNINVMEAPEEGREKEAGTMLQAIMAENYPNLMKNINLEIQEAQNPK